MLDRTLVYTAFTSALMGAFTLLTMDFFSFIKWSPIGWARNIFSFIPEIYHWLILVFLLFLFFVILYLIMRLAWKGQPSVTAIVLAVCTVFTVEYFRDMDRSIVATIKSISLPLLATTSIIFRFVSGTASFHKKEAEEKNGMVSEKNDNH